MTPLQRINIDHVQEALECTDRVPTDLRSGWFIRSLKNDTEGCEVTRFSPLFTHSSGFKRNRAQCETLD